MDNLFAYESRDDSSQNWGNVVDQDWLLSLVNWNKVVVKQVWTKSSCRVQRSACERSDRVNERHQNDADIPTNHDLVLLSSDSSEYCHDEGEGRYELQYKSLAM